MRNRLAVLVAATLILAGGNVLSAAESPSLVLETARAEVIALSVEYLALEGQSDEDQVEDRLAALEEALAALRDRVADLEERLAALTEDEDELELPTQPTQPSSVTDTLEGLIDSSTSVMDASTIAGSGAAFLWSPKTQRTPENLELSNLAEEPSLSYQQLPTRRGVSRAKSERNPNSGMFRYLRYGGWMDESFFYVRKSEIHSSDPLHPSQSTFVYVYSLGEASGSNPVSGSATWNGMVVGIDVSDSPTEGDLIEGDATIDIDSFTRPDVDVAFTSLRDQDTGRSRSSITWNNLPLVRGAFRGSGIRGQFYGSRHQEVGGIFVRNNISGAFGASR